jgi:hypothetical protein
MAISKNTGIEYEIISETKTRDLVDLLKLYKEDKVKSKVFFEFMKKNSKFTSERVVLYGGGNFRLVSYIRTFGISKTNILYNREKIVSCVGLKQNRYYNYSAYSKSFFSGTLYTLLNESSGGILGHGKKLLLEKHPFIEDLLGIENIGHLSVSTILRSKLYTYGKCLSHMYNTSEEIAILISNNYRVKSPLPAKIFIKVWRAVYLPLILNIEKLSKEFITDKYFEACISVSIKLSLTIDCEWDVKELREKYYERGKMLGDIMLDIIPDERYELCELFNKFNNFSDLNPLLNKHDIMSFLIKQNITYKEELFSTYGKGCLYYVFGDNLFMIRLGHSWEQGVFVSLDGVVGFNGCVVNDIFKVILLEMIADFNKKLVSIDYKKDRAYSFYTNHLELVDEVPF